MKTKRPYVLNFIKIFQGPVFCGDFLSFVFVFAILSCLFLAASRSPVGIRAGLFVLLCVMFSCVLSLSKTGVLGQVCYLIVLDIDLCLRPNFIQKYHIL